MRLTTTFNILVCLFIGYSLAACDAGKREAPFKEGMTADRAQHFGVKVIQTLFPKRIGDYRLNDFKYKVKSSAIAEYKGNYVSGAQEVKLVVTDWLEDRPSDWKPKIWHDQIAASGQTTKNFPSMVHQKKDKESVLVMVSKRMRVESKSRNVSGESLVNFSLAVDYDAFAKLAQNRGD